MGLFSRWWRADDYTEPFIGIRFPETLGAYERGKATSYSAEPGQSGTAVVYRSVDAEVTIFVRMTDEDAHKSSADFLQDALQGIKALEARGDYSHVQIYESAPERERTGWKTAAFTGRAGTQLIASFIYCKVVPGHVVKIRATTNNPKNDELYTCLTQLQATIDQARAR